MDYLYILNTPIDANLDASFLVTIEFSPMQEKEAYEIVFEVMGRGIFFKEDDLSLGTKNQTLKRFDHDPSSDIQQATFEIVVSIEQKPERYPIRTILRARTYSSDLIFCRLNIYNTNA